MLCSLLRDSSYLLKLSRHLCFRNFSVTMPEVAGEKRSAEIAPVEEENDIAKKAKVDEGRDTKDKLKMKKYAMCISYCGKGYLGLQVNGDLKTIEKDVLTALLKADLISEENFNRPQGMQFQRAARTDKGVSAVRQVLSLKLPTTRGEPEKLVESINEHLVDQIRVVGLKRATRGFNAKNNADSRTYLYLCPTFAFMTKDETPTETYRIPSEKLEQINELLKKYVGCHNFHNFTSGRLASDASAKRYIIEMECGQPFLINNIEYVQFRVWGQSFMLHQIRKMVGVVVGIIRGYAPPEFIEKAYGSEKLDLPKAPPLGLMLDRVHYTRYDKRYASDGSHEPITWTEHQDFVHEFKEKHILPNIWTEEEKGESMMSWLKELELCTFDAAREHESLNKFANDAPEEEEDDDGGEPDERS